MWAGLVHSSRKLTFLSACFIPGSIAKLHNLIAQRSVGGIPTTEVFTDNALSFREEKQFTGGHGSSKLPLPTGPLDLGLISLFLFFSFLFLTVVSLSKQTFI